jgi:hypothetical protein
MNERVAAAMTDPKPKTRAEKAVEQAQQIELD